MAEGGAIEIRANETRIIIANYNDPDNPGKRVAGFVDSDTAIVEEDVTWTGDFDDLTFAITAGGNSAKIEVTNGGNYVGILSKMQLKGRMVTVFDPQVAEAFDSDSITTYDERPMRLSMKYQNSIIFAQDLVNVVLSERKDGRLIAKTVKFVANQNSTLMNAAMRGEPGIRIALSSLQAGKSAEEYFIDAVEFDVRDGRVIHVTWSVSLADVKDYFIIDSDSIDGPKILGL